MNLENTNPIDLEVERKKAEDADCLSMWLDKLEVPSKDEIGDFSLVGRVVQLLKMNEANNYASI